MNKNLTRNLKKKKKITKKPKTASEKCDLSDILHSDFHFPL